LPAAPRPTSPIFGAQNPTGVPAELANADLVKRGEYLVRAVDCAACHNASGRRSFAGGYVFRLPFGTIYSSNITPDKETGIGAWSDADFLRALHDGVGKDGENLYPAFPYTFGEGYSDAEIAAVVNYVTGRFGTSPSKVTAAEIATLRRGD
jgi:mono/diheme cytochrome c family protein